MPASTSKRVIKPAEVRRSELLHAALEACIEKGVAAATVQDITARAGVAKGTFYIYFSSKDHIVESLWKQYIDGFLGLAHVALNDSDIEDPVDRFAMLLTRLIDHAVKHAELHRAIYDSADASALALCRERNAEVVELLAGHIAEQVAAGTFRRCDPDIYANLIYHGLHETLHQIIVADPEHGRDRVISSVNDLVRWILTVRDEDDMAKISF